MFRDAYEALLGWRYLLRLKRQPRVLWLGLGVLLFGALLLGAGAWWQHQETGMVSIFGLMPPLSQGLMGGGAALIVLGACVSLFGALNTYLTVFAAFSTFMVSIGVAEVILVLGVMNGFQQDLRSKIIGTQAHLLIEPAQQGGYLEEYKALSDRVREAPGVIGATPVLQTEVMLSAPSNLSAVMLSGVDPETLGEANRLSAHLKSAAECREDELKEDGSCGRWRGKIEFLTHPERLDYALLRAAGIPFREGDVAGRVQPPKTPEPKLESPPEAMTMMAFPKPGRLKAGPPPSLLIGMELRRSLALWPGEPVNVVSPLGDLGPNGPIPKNRPFRVGGWFQSGMLLFDSRLAYAELGAVQRYLGLGDVVGAIQLRVEELEAARGVRDHLRAALGPEYRITDWQERNRGLFSALKLEKIAMFLVLSINILLAAFSITSTLVMTIIERKREIAILMSMGSSKASILRVFMSQGALTGALGSVVGSSIGLGLGLILSKMGLPLNTEVYYISAIPVDVRVVDVLAIIGVALLVSLISTLYPALYASRLRPVEGLNA